VFACGGRSILRLSYLYKCTYRNADDSIDRYTDIDIFLHLSVFGMHVAAVGVQFFVCHVYINLPIS